jgi:hypothetical protein
MIHPDKINLQDWLALKQEQDKTLIAEQVTISRKGQCLIYIYSKAGQLFCAIENSLGETFDYPKVEGFEVEIGQLDVESSGVREYIIIHCSNSTFFKTFVWFIREVSIKILSQISSPRQSILYAIDLLRGFIQDTQLSILTKEEQCGLLCELVILEKFIKSDLNKGLSFWQVKGKLEQDFITSVWVLEIKGTTRQIHEHTINGIDQLEVPPKFKLAVISFTLSEGDGISIQQAVDEIDMKYFYAHPLQRKVFYEKLRLRNYSIWEKDEYAKYKFQIMEGRIYEIENNTPRIVRNSFRSSLPSAVSKIRYNLNFEGINFTKLEEINFSDFFL